MNPSVFISHSCKDHEDAPPADLSREEIDARAARLKFACAIRDELKGRLDAIDNLDVFLDVRGGLNPGDVWQDGLHKELRTCSGAVVFLSPESLESGWVLKEATILSWRVFLGEEIVLVPVVLGVSDQEIREKGFGAVNLDAIQWVKVADSSPAERAAAVEAIVEALAPVAEAGLRGDRTQWKTTAERWLYELADLLNAAVPERRAKDYLTEMYRALSVAPLDRDRAGEDPFVDVATTALTSDTDSILKLLTRIPADRSQREELKRRVRSFWVDAAAASKLPHVQASSGVAAIDGDEVESARDYITRAYCTHIPADRVLTPNDKVEATPEQAVTLIEDYLGEYLPIENIEELKQDVHTHGPTFVILGPGFTQCDVLDTLTDRYDPPLTFVALAGPQPRKRLAAWFDRVLLLQPNLRPGAERKGKRYRNRLKAFVKGKA